MDSKNLPLAVLLAALCLTGCGGASSHGESEPCDATQTAAVTDHVSAAKGHIVHSDYAAAARSFGLAAGIEDSCDPGPDVTPCRYYANHVGSAFMVQDRAVVAEGTRIWVECLERNAGYVPTSDERVVLVSGAAVAGLEPPVSLPPGSHLLERALDARGAR